MKRSLGVVTLCVAAFASIAGAYDYPLQFTPNPGYRGLVVAGYAFEGSGVVVGNCSYYTVSGRSGRGGGSGAVTKHYDQTCRWDLYGNLLTVTPGAPVEPAPLYVKGDQTIYADNGNGSQTGTETEHTQRGFVSTPGPHYSWITPNNNAVFRPVVHSHVITLKSDGDVPVNISAVSATALRGAVTLNSTTCIGQIEVGATCAVTITYDPTGVPSVDGLAYDTLRIDLTSDAGAPADFIQNFTVVLPSKL